MALVCDDLRSWQEGSLRHHLARWRLDERADRGAAQADLDPRRAYVRCRCGNAAIPPRRPRRHREWYCTHRPSRLRQEGAAAAPVGRAECTEDVRRPARRLAD